MRGSFGGGGGHLKFNRSRFLRVNTRFNNLKKIPIYRAQ